MKADHIGNGILVSVEFRDLDKKKTDDGVTVAY